MGLCCLVWFVLLAIVGTRGLHERSNNIVRRVWFAVNAPLTHQRN